MFNGFKLNGFLVMQASVISLNLPIVCPCAGNKCSTYINVNKHGLLRARESACKLCYALSPERLAAWSKKEECFRHLQTRACKETLTVKFIKSKPFSDILGFDMRHEIRSPSNRTKKCWEKYFTCSMNKCSKAVHCAGRFQPCVKCYQNHGVHSQK